MYESPTHKPHITISITIIALFIVELVDAAGLLLVQGHWGYHVQRCGAVSQAGR